MAARRNRRDESDPRALDRRFMGHRTGSQYTSAPNRGRARDVFGRGIPRRQHALVVVELAVEGRQVLDVAGHAVHERGTVGGEHLDPLRDRVVAGLAERHELLHLTDGHAGGAQ